MLYWVPGYLLSSICDRMLSEGMRVVCIDWEMIWLGRAPFCIWAKRSALLLWLLPVPSILLPSK